jgi:hypothetical protein
MPFADAVNTLKPALTGFYNSLTDSRSIGEPRVEELALPKSVESDNLSLNKLVIRWMSVDMWTALNLAVRQIPT